MLEKHRGILFIDYACGFGEGQGLDEAIHVTVSVSPRLIDELKKGDPEFNVNGMSSLEIAKTIIHYIGEVGFMGYIKNCAIKDVSPLVDALLQGGKDIQMGPLLCQYILVCRASEGLCT